MLNSWIKCSALFHESKVFKVKKTGKNSSLKYLVKVSESTAHSNQADCSSETWPEEGAADQNAVHEGRGFAPRFHQDTQAQLGRHFHD